MLAFLSKLFRRSGNWHQMFNRDTGGDEGRTRLADPLCSPWVLSGIQQIVAQLLAAPLSLRDERGQPLNDAALNEFWNAPAIGADGPLTWEQFVECTAAWIMLEGQAFWILDDTSLFPSARRSPLVIARPEDIRPVVIAGQLSHWQWLDGSRRAHILLPEQVMRPRIVHPRDDLRGLSPFAAAKLTAETDHSAGTFAKNLMDSNGDRGAFITAKNGVSDEQRAQIEAKLREKRRLNRAGIFSISFLTGDLEIQDPTVHSADAQFLDNRKASRQEIYAALGLPMSMAEVTVAYSIGSASDRCRLLEHTCIPLASRITSAITAVERRHGSRARAALDWSQHSVMRQVRGEGLKQAAELHARGIPWERLNEMFHLGMAPFPGWAEAWLPMSLTPVSDTTTPGERIAARLCQTPSPDDPANALRSLLACRASVPDAEPALPYAEPAEPDPARVALWRSHMARRAPALKVFRTGISKTLQAARKETLRRLTAAAALEGYRARGILDILFSLADFTVKLVSTMRGAHENALIDAAAQLTEELGLSDPWRMPDPLAAEFLRSRENKIKNAAKEIHDDIKTAIQDGLDNRESIAQIGERVKGAFNAADKERAEMIATTELASAFGAARERGLADAGIAEKEWLSAQDERTRAAHRAADGQHVPNGEAFIVDGEPLQHPGDPEGSAKNVINCRCVLIAHVP